MADTKLLDVDQAPIRARAVSLAQWALLLAAVGFLLFCADLYVSCFGRWLLLVDRARGAVGLPPPGTGPDWLIVSAYGIAIALPLGLALLTLWWHRRQWRRNLRNVWPAGTPRKHRRVRRLLRMAQENELRHRGEYLEALLRSPEWTSAIVSGHERVAVMHSDDSAYRAVAAGILGSIEPDIRNRALVAGLAVGVTRNRLIETLTIAASALELQLHVLKRLGKKPSLRVWIQLWRSTAASLFLNTYLNREDCYAVRLAITKAALGLEATGELLHQLGDSLVDFDLDGLLPDVAGFPLHSMAEAVTSVTGHSLAIGADGVKRIGNLVDRSGIEILEGVLAGGVLYYHGMSLAADCLALDRVHRSSPEMNRSVRQAVFGLCTGAADVVRSHVRETRQLLRQKRGQAVKIAREKLKARGRATLASFGRPRSESKHPAGNDSEAAVPAKALDPTAPASQRRWWFGS